VLETSRLIAEVKERHGIRIEPGDAGFALVTLNQLVLEDFARQLSEGVRSGIVEFDKTVQRTEARAGTTLAQHVKTAVAEVRGDLQRDLESARSAAAEIVLQVPRTHYWVTLIKWVTAGLIAGVALFAAGLWTGMHYFR
jgi:hypothetical protein